MNHESTAKTQEKSYHDEHKKFSPEHLWTALWMMPFFFMALIVVSIFTSFLLNLIMPSVGGFTFMIINFMLATIIVFLGGGSAMHFFAAKQYRENQRLATQER